MKRKRSNKEKKLSDGFWRLTNGHYLMDTRDQDGRRIRKTWSDRDQARREYRKIVHEIATGAFVNPNAEYATFAAFSTVFLEKYVSPRTGKAPRTSDYKDHINSLLPFFGEIPVSDAVKPEVWRDAAAKFMEARTERGFEKRAAKTLRALQTMLGFAVRLGYVKRNPLKEAKVIIPTEKKAGKFEYFTTEEFARLLAASPAELRPMQRFAVATGFRLKEVTGLRWSDVDFHAGLIWTNADSKTGRVESVKMGAEPRRVLQEQRRRWMQQGQASQRVFSNGEGLDYHIFYRPVEDGEQQPCRNWIVKTMRRVCDKIGKPQASFHTLRHTCASWAVQARVPLAVVQKLMRHASIEMTMRYAHLAPEQQEEATNALDAACAAAREFGHNLDTPAPLQS